MADADMVVLPIVNAPSKREMTKKPPKINAIVNSNDQFVILQLKISDECPHCARCSTPYTA